MSNLVWQKRKNKMNHGDLLKNYKKIKTERKGDFLYFIQSSNKGEIKIGRSKNPEKRLRNLQTGNPNKLRIVASLEGLGWREKDLHDQLKKWRGSGEWFDYQCVGSIPIEIYELIPYGVLDDWWDN